MNFGNLPKAFSQKDNAKVVILPVPYDGTSTWIKGADRGPDAIIEASANMELYDIENDMETYKIGIYTASPVKEKRSPERMTKAVYETSKEWLKENKFLVTIGGEHSVSIGAIKAHKEKYQDLTVLQIDAHSDMRNEYEGSKHNHACVMARAKEMCPCVQVGIRSMDIDEKPNIDPAKIFYAEAIQFDKTWQDKVVSCLTNNVYITIDLDGFDPSIMPSTGTPEPGGLLWYETLELLKKISQSVNIVGFDVVELCPMKYNKAPNFLAAKLIYKILTYRFLNK